MIVLISVDLPLPLGPRIATCSPASTVRVKPFRAEAVTALNGHVLEVGRRGDEEEGKIRIEGSIASHSGTGKGSWRPNAALNWPASRLAAPHEDFSRFDAWRAAGLAGEMGYLTDHRGDLRADPRHLLPEARRILCVGKLYNTDAPHTVNGGGQGWISRYAWGADYHEVVQEGLLQLAKRIEALHGEPLAWRACVDTAPLLERSYARAAGLGWIGKNTCLINQQGGSWFFLGELLLSLEFPTRHACARPLRNVPALHR